MFNIDNTIKRMIGNKRFGGKGDWDGDGISNKRDCQPFNVMRQDKVYIKDRYGLRIKFHRIKNPSPKVIGAMGFFVDQVTNRAYEYGLKGSDVNVSRSAAYTNIAKAAIQEHNLTGKDLSDFIVELKARKYGVRL